MCKVLVMIILSPHRRTGKGSFCTPLSSNAKSEMSFLSLMQSDFVKLTERTLSPSCFTRALVLCCCHGSQGEEARTALSPCSTLPCASTTAGPVLCSLVPFGVKAQTRALGLEGPFPHHSSPSCTLLFLSHISDFASYFESIRSAPAIV